MLITVAALVAEISLSISLFNLAESAPDNTDKLTRLGYGLFISQTISILGAQLALYAFAIKYWIVGQKLQLAQAEINMESKNKMFTLVLFGGGALYALLTILPIILETIALNKLDLKKLKIAGKLNGVIAIVLIFVSILFLADGFRRINQVVKEGQCINKKLVLTIFVGYFAEAIDLTMSFILGGIKINVGSLVEILLLDISFVLSFSILATVLFELAV